MSGVHTERRWRRKLNTEASERERSQHDAKVFASLNSTGLEPGAPTPFCETYIRQAPGGGWYLVNRPEQGWGSYSIWYRSLRDCLSRWSVYVVGAGTDKCSFFYRVCPAANGERS